MQFTEATIGMNSGKFPQNDPGNEQTELVRLREEHRDLDTAIEALLGSGLPDQLQLQRLKKRKLFLRDRISVLTDQITPDIIA
jgi:hypothetical protein